MLNFIDFIISVAELTIFAIGWAVGKHDRSASRIISSEYDKHTIMHELFDDRIQYIVFKTALYEHPIVTHICDISPLPTVDINRKNKFAEVAGVLKRNSLDADK